MIPDEPGWVRAPALAVEYADVDRDEEDFLINPVPVEALYDGEAARTVVFRNLLQSRL